MNNSERKKINIVLFDIETRKKNIRNTINDNFFDKFNVKYIWDYHTFYANDYLLNLLYKKAEKCIKYIDYHRFFQKQKLSP